MTALTDDELLAINRFVYDGGEITRIEPARGAEPRRASATAETPARLWRGTAFGGAALGTRVGLADGARRDGSIERLLQWAAAEGAAREDRAEFGRGGRDMLAVIAEIAAVGCRIDGGGPRLADDPPEDAQRIVAAAREASGESWPLLRAMAQACRRPEVRAEARNRVVPREIRVRRDGSIEGRSELIGVYRWRRPSGLVYTLDIRWTPVQVVNDPREVEAERERYCCWWRSLHAARALLRDGPPLARWTLTDAMPPAAPWLAGRRSAQPRGQR